MKTQKLYSKLHSTDEFISYYKGACRSELKTKLKSIGNTRDITKKHERDAVQALLA